MAKTWWTIGARVLVFFSTAAATIVMRYSNVTSHSDHFTVQARYNEWPSLSYFMAANSITSGYSFLVLFLPSGSLLWKPVAVMDVIMSMFIATGGTSCAVVADIINNGIPQAGCNPYCFLVPVFASRVIGALAVCCVGILIQFILSIYTFSYVINPLLLQ